jgi:hypothetical protein
VTKTGSVKTTPPSKPVRKAKPTTGRLPRRSPEEIAKALEQVVALLATHPGGLRAEQIRAELGMDVREMPRVLQAGVAHKMLKSKGEKRATTYTAV